MWLQSQGEKLEKLLDTEPAPAGDLETGIHTFNVGDLAYTRSGDKANSAIFGQFDFIYRYATIKSQSFPL